MFSIKDKEKESLLTPDDIREYCGRLFEIRIEDTVIKRYSNDCLNCSFWFNYVNPILVLIVFFTTLF